MKALLIVVLVLDMFLIVGAGVRVMTSTQNTEPLISFSSSDSSDASYTEEEELVPGGARDAVVGHINRSKRVDEIGQTGSISTSNPHGNTGSSATGSLERASEITDGRESDLDDAKSKIGKIGK